VATLPSVYCSSASAGVSIVGLGAGLAFLCGVTLIGGEVDDAVRGRVFAFVQTAARALRQMAGEDVVSLHRAARRGLARRTRRRRIGSTDRSGR